LGIKLTKEEEKQERQSSVDLSSLWKWLLFLLEIVWKIIVWPIRMIAYGIYYFFKGIGYILRAIFSSDFVGAIVELICGILEVIFSGW
jgi:hypothetical protein